MLETRTKSVVLLGLLAALGAAPASAANLLLNPYFHSNPNDWELENGNSFAQASAEDEGGCAGSGAGQVGSAPGQGAEQASILQCVVPPAAGLTYFARARHKGSGDFSIKFRLFHTTGCGGVPDGSSAATPAAQSPSEWRTLESSVFVNMDTSSIEIVLSAENDTPHNLFVDAVELSADPSIFVDDFEGNEGGETQPCRWVSP